MGLLNREEAGSAPDPRPAPRTPAVVRLDLEREASLLLDSATNTRSGRSGRSGRSARTLVKDGPLSVTLVALSPGGTIPEHVAPGPITIQAVQGSIQVDVGRESYLLLGTQILSIPGGRPHAVSSASGGTFLLTLVNSGTGSPPTSSL